MLNLTMEEAAALLECVEVLNNDEIKSAVAKLKAYIESKEAEK